VKLRILAPPAAALMILAAAVACSDEAAMSRFAGTDDAGAANDGGFGAQTDAAVGTASGVVVLHAAAFPPFRLCFEGYPELAPQPDTALMPEANVVGVEVGSAIRISPLPKPPGKVYVIDQREIRATPRDPLDRKCGALIGDPDFALDRKYQVAGEITTPLGVGHVDVLAITGCAGKAWLTELGLSSEGCTDWDQTSGSLRARTVELLPTVQATGRSLPVQIVHMSPLLDAKLAPGERVDVSFGALAESGSMDQHIEVPALFEAGAPAMLTLDQNTESVFGSHGFRISLRSTGEVDAGDRGQIDAAATFVVEQSLAQVQELSFSQTVPTAYYLAASNYALLLLGDPGVLRTYVDGGVNPFFDPRRAVHLLAVPVKAEVDAGSDPSAGLDASVTAAPDGG
jgi:hypothetical protein